MPVARLSAAGLRLCRGEDCKRRGDRYEHENEDHHESEHVYLAFFGFSLKQDKDGARERQWPSPVGMR